MPKSSWNEQNGGHLSPTPPKYLGTIASAMWRKVVPFLAANGKNIRRVDQNLVELYCTQYEIYRDAYRSIREKGTQIEITRSVQNNRGEIIGTDTVAYRRNPATQVYNDALKQLTAVGAQLGLSPKSRAELAGLVGDGSDSGNVDVTAALKEMFGGEMK